MTKSQEWYLTAYRGRILETWDRATQAFLLKHNDWEPNSLLVRFGLKTPFQTAKGE